MLISWGWSQATQERARTRAHTATVKTGERESGEAGVLVCERGKKSQLRPSLSWPGPPPPLSLSAPRPGLPRTRALTHPIGRCLGQPCDPDKNHAPHHPTMRTPLPARLGRAGAVAGAAPISAPPASLARRGSPGGVIGGATAPTCSRASPPARRSVASAAAAGAGAAAGSSSSAAPRLLTPVRLAGTGSSTPSASIHNDDFAAMGVDTTDDWIFARTGIQCVLCLRERERAERASAPAPTFFCGRRRRRRTRGVDLSSRARAPADRPPRRSLPFAPSRAQGIGSARLRECERLEAPLP